MLRVTVLDDDVDFLRLIEFKLKAKGYIVECQTEPDEVLQNYRSLNSQSVNESAAYLESFQDEILIVDYQMPKKSGIDVVKEIRQMARFRYMPILMLTSEDAAEILEKSIESGVDYFLNKSANTRQLVPQILSFAKKKAEYQSRIKKLQHEVAATMVATIQHQAGNSLAKISSYLYLLKRDESSNTTVVDLVHKAECEIQNLSGVVRRLGDFEGLRTKAYAEDIRILDLDRE